MQPLQSVQPEHEALNGSVMGSRREVQENHYIAKLYDRLKVQKYSAYLVKGFKEWK